MPAGAQLSSVKLLTSGARPKPEYVNGVLTVAIPSIELHEVIAIDL